MPAHSILFRGVAAALAAAAAVVLPAVAAPSAIALPQPAAAGGVAAVVPSATLPSHDGTDPTSSMPAFLDAAYFDVEATWGRIFSASGIPTAPAAYRSWTQPQESVTTGCGRVTNDLTMEYCSADDTIWFSQALAVALWTGQYATLTNPTHGDMSVAVMVAHEFGHDVEAEIGRMQGETPAVERGADCFAGVWFADASARGVVDSTDLDEAQSVLDLVAEHPEFNQSDNGLHGSPAERQQAFELGRQQGPQACLDAYLPGDGTTVFPAGSWGGVDNSHNPIPDQGTGWGGVDNSHNPVPDQGTGWGGVVATQGGTPSWSSRPRALRAA